MVIPFLKLPFFTLVKMGAFASYTKREHPNNPLDHSFYVSKKQRLAHSRDINPSLTLVAGSINSTVARVSSYPEGSVCRKLKREVHAPCRAVRFGLTKPKGECFREDRMGNSLGRRLDLAKKRAVDTLRFVSVGDKEVPEVVVDVDEDHNGLEDLPQTKGTGSGSGSDSSGVEEIEVINDRSDGSDVEFLEDRLVVTLDEDAVVVDNGRTMMGSSGGDQGADFDNVEVYWRLWDQSERRRSSRLRELNFDIELNEKKLRSLRLSKPPRKSKKEVIPEIPPEPFIPLTSEDEAEIKRAFSSSNRKKLLVSHENTCIDITGEALLCLKPGAWLNDEVINVYLELLKEREKREPQKFLKCHFFNTFFYKKLTAGGFNYRAVRRWTTEKKLGYVLLDCEKIFVPVHREVHWCLAIINKKDQKFQYLDSLGRRDSIVLHNLAKYYVEEVKDKCGKDIDVSNWQREFPQDLPSQENGYDCGMFMIKYADFYSRGLGLCFSQADMPYFRLRTAKEVLRLRAD